MGRQRWRQRRARCISRPARSDERLQLNAAGQVKLKLKTPWRDGLDPQPPPRGRAREQEHDFAS